MIAKRPTSRWITLRPHEAQKRYYESTARFNVVPAGRRSGKSEVAKRRIVRRCIARVIDMTPRFHNGRFFCAAPTFNQAKRIYWSDLKLMIPAQYMAGRPLESELIIRMKNNVELHVIGMDKPERFEGSPWDGGILDEYGNMKEEAWMQNVFPALADRQGWCDLIGVPEGRNHYFDRYKEALSCTDGTMAAHHWKSSEILPPAEIAMARRMLDDLSFRQEFEAEFVSFAGQCYYPFNDAEHVSTLGYDPDAPLIFCFDFNVAPGVAAVIQEGVPIPGSFELMPDPELYKPNDMWAWEKAIKEERLIRSPVFGTGIIGEVFIKSNSNTPAVCRKLIQDWGNHRGRIVCYGDATGGSRGTAKVAGSDWELIENALYAHFGSDRVFFEVPQSNPPERTRINAVNARLKSLDGVVRLAVDPSCRNVIRDFEGVRLLEGGSGEIDKKKDKNLSHMCFSEETLVNGERIDRLPEVGIVRTFNGYSDFVNPGLRGEKELVELVIEDRKPIRCTPDHPILTSVGWRPALDCSDALGYFLVEGEWTCQKTQSLSTERTILGTENTTAANSARAYISRFGRFTMALFQKAIAYITKTVTDAITPLQTCFAYQGLNMQSYIWQRPNGKHCQQNALNSTHGQRQRSGTNQMQAENGIRNITNKCSLPYTRNTIIHANNVEGPISQVEKNAPNSAAAHVKRQRVEIQALTTLQRSANGVEENTGATNTTPSANSAPAHVLRRILAVKKLPGLHKVYCPTVAAGHFVLDCGLVVSNSDSIGYFLVREYPIVDNSYSTVPVTGRF